MSALESELIILLEEHFYAKKGAIHPHTQLEQVVRDSMDFVELIALLTTRYKVTFKPTDLASVRTVADVARALTNAKTATKISDGKFAQF